MFDKWKIRQQLCRAYKIYNQKTKSVLYSDLYTFEEYKQLQEVQYAIAYVLCEYFDFNYEFYYNNFPFSYKWSIAYDYIKYYDECKEAYGKIIKQNNTYNCIAWSIKNFKGNYYTKGDIIYSMENGCLYIYDGKNLQNMC